MFFYVFASMASRYIKLLPLAGWRSQAIVDVSQNLSAPLPWQKPSLNFPWRSCGCNVFPSVTELSYGGTKYLRLLISKVWKHQAGAEYHQKAMVNNDYVNKITKATRPTTLSWVQPCQKLRCNLHTLFKSSVGWSCTFLYGPCFAGSTRIARTWDIHRVSGSNTFR